MLLVVIVSRLFSFHWLGVLILSFAAVQLPPSTVNDLTPILIPSPSVSRPLSQFPFFLLVVKLLCLVAPIMFMQTAITSHSAYDDPCRSPPSRIPGYINTPSRCSCLSSSLLIVYTAVRLIFPLRRTYIPLTLLDMVIVFIYVHFWCLTLRCSALAEVRGEGGR